MGNGSSICAIDGGKSVDTSMGFTPLVGLPMGTRCGDLDSGIIQYLMNKYGYGIDEMMNILNKKSGVLGVSGISSDFRDLEEASEKGNADAQLALDLFHYEVAKTVGSYAVAMNGVDAIIFTAGIGENSKGTRTAICEYFSCFSCWVDPEANAKRGQEIVISTPESRVKLLVIPTNEELVIARDTETLMK
jgi:acetate kinase